jgi:hypothetical protein
MGMPFDAALVRQHYQSMKAAAAGAALGQPAADGVAS